MTVTVTGDHPARVVRAGRACIRVRSGEARVGARRFTPAVYPTGNHDQLIIVEAISENPLAEVRGAKVDRLSWVLNGMGDMGWTCSAYDDALDVLVDPATVVDGAGNLKLVGKEVQWWRNGVLYWAGVPVVGKPNLDGTVAFECHDQAWYLARRFWGAAERKDLLRDVGSMERAGLPGWAADGATMARTDATRARGNYSMSLTGSGFASTSFTHPTITKRNDSAVWATAMVKVPAGTPKGTQLLRIDVRGVLGGAIVSQSGVVTFDDTIGTGSWQRIACYGVLPTGGPHVVTVTLISTAGRTTYFDDVRSLRNDTTGSPHAEGDDLTTHGLAAIDHAQIGRGQGTFGFHRRTLYQTGTTEVMGVRHLEHTQLTDWLSMMTDRSDGFDWWIDPRTRTVWFSNRRGRDLTNRAIDDRTPGAGGWVSDWSEVASKVVVVGDGDGVDRPEGGKTDTSRSAGLVLDYLYRPPNGTPLSALDPMADQMWEEKSQPQVSPDRLSVPGSWLDDIQPGDTIAMTKRIGKVRMSQRIRVGSMTLDLDSDSLELS